MAAWSDVAGSFLQGGIGMNKFLKSPRTGIKLITLIIGVMTILLLAAPALAADLTPEQKLARAAELSARAAELAATAQETGNMEMAQEALALAGEASNLINEVAAYAGDVGNAELAQSAMNQAVALSATVGQVTATAQYVAANSTNPAVVNTANQILVQTGEILTLNQGTMELALNAGATPPAEGYQPPAPPAPDAPVGDEPPIDDTTAASQV